MNHFYKKQQKQLQEIKNRIQENRRTKGETYPAQSEDPDGFVPALVEITSSTQAVSNLMERLFNEEIDLSPAFQHHNDLWDKVKQNRLIESLMLRIPVPSFYF